MKKHILIGTGAGIALLLVYFGLLSLVQGVGHALDQSSRLWYWILLLVVGFGVQAGLFSFVRQALHQRHRANTVSVTTSGGISAGSMVACCVHHLADVAPLLGLSGLAGFLAGYQTIFIVIGVLSNAIGITIMLETIQRHGLCLWVARWRCNMTRVKKWAMVSASLLLVAAFVANFLAKGAILG